MSDEREVDHECAYDTVGAGPCVTCLTAAPTEAEREALAEWFHRQTCLQPNADYHPLDEDDYAAADDFLPLLAQVKATARAEAWSEGWLAAGVPDYHPSDALIRNPYRADAIDGGAQ
jgi:hypothetical protein